MHSISTTTDICYITVTVSLFFLSISSVWALFHCDFHFFFNLNVGRVATPITPLPPLAPLIGYDTRNTEIIIILREKQWIRYHNFLSFCQQLVICIFIIYLIHFHECWGKPFYRENFKERKFFEMCMSVILYFSYVTRINMILLFMIAN